MFFKKRFFVVVHVLAGEGGLEHALSSIKICSENGGDGVFLIPDYEKGRDAMARPEDVMRYYTEAKRAFPDFKIGVNFLAKFEEEITSFLSSQKPDMIQIDGKSILSGFNFPESMETFCGVAFKYSSYQDVLGGELEKHCLRISDVCDVPTTSGAATGMQADL